MDDPAWHAWYNRHAARLLLYARQWLADRASAEDAVQGGFVKVWRGCRPGEAPDVPLLYAAVRSEALDLLKSHARRRAREDRVADGGDRDWWEDDPLVSVPAKTSSSSRWRCGSIPPRSTHLLCTAFPIPVSLWRVVP